MLNQNRCPVCSTRVETVWESSGNVKTSAWWTGLYTCSHCGFFKASGVGGNGTRRTVQWHPGCPKHGTDPVVMIAEGEWACMHCKNRMKIQGSKIVISQAPDEMPQEVANAIDFNMREMSSRVG